MLEMGWRSSRTLGGGALGEVKGEEGARLVEC